MLSLSLQSTSFHGVASARARPTSPARAPPRRRRPPSRPQVPSRVQPTMLFGAKASAPKKAPAFAYGLPGNFNALGGSELNWDPAGFLEGKSELEVNRYREAELTHGRVGMLASLGFLVQEKFHPLFSGDTDIAINQVPQLPIWLWAGMLAGIAGAEQTRIAKGWQKLDQRSYTASESLREGYMPGDLGFDPFKIKPQDPEKLLDMQEKELSHGRLAMIAAMGFLAQETVTGQTWGAFWGDASF